MRILVIFLLLFMSPSVVLQNENVVAYKTDFNLVIYHKHTYNNWRKRK